MSPIQDKPDTTPGSGDQLVAWLKGQLSTLPGGAKLPSDARLGKQWGLSERTVRRLLGPLGRDGLLVRIRGKGTFVPAASSPEPAIAEADLTASEHLERVLADAIRRGEIKRGDTLPQSKFLQMHYGLSPKTVARACRSLEHEGLVRRVGQRYCVGGVLARVHPSRRRDVLLLVRSAADLQRVFTGDTMSLAYRPFERELRTCGFSLDYGVVDDLPRLVTSWRRRGTAPGGLVLWRSGYGDHAKLAGILKPVLSSGTGTRTTLLVDAHAVEEGWHGTPNVEILSRGNIMTTQARTVADFIARTKPCSCCLVCDADTIRSRGGRYFLRYQKVPATTGERTGYDMPTVIVDPTGELTAAWIMENVFAPHRWYLDYLDTKLGGAHRVTPRNVPPLISVVDRLSEALPDRKDSLALFTHDHLASQALTLRSRNRAAASLRLLTLEGLPGNLHLGLSSCAPDWDTIGYLLAHAIVDDFPLEHTHRGFIRVPCPVVERSTT